MAIIKDYNAPTDSLHYTSLTGSSVTDYWSPDYSAYGTNYLAQTFTAGSSYKITKLIIPLVGYIQGRKKYGGHHYWGNSGTVRASIQSVDGNNKPSGTDLTSVETKPFSTLPERGAYGALSDFTNFVFSFETPANLVSGTMYSIVIKNTGGTGRVSWSLDKTSGYASGQAYTSANSGSTWTAASTYDFWFETYIDYEVQNTLVTGTEASLSLGGVYWAAQTFTTASDYIIKSIELNVARANSDIGAVVVGLRVTDINGKPSGEDLSIGTLYSSEITVTTKGWEEFVLDVPYKLATGTQYAIVIRTTTSTYPGIYVDYVTSDVLANGTKVYSENSGGTWTVNATEDIWFKIRGTVVGAGTAGISLTSDATSTKKLIAIGSSEFWYENNSGAMVVLSDSVGQIDCTQPLTHVEAYGKIFIANGKNLKVADFSNVKITTTSIGSHPPDFGTVLTGGTTGAVMVVDYVDALASAVTIYGRRINNYPFQAEVVTGLDNDGNDISFTGTAEVRPPHWYNWTTFGNSTNFGAMPESATLVSLYNGRIVLAGSYEYPHEWWMSEVYNPFNYFYTAGSNLTAVSSGSTEAGEIGDVITALISLGDDFFVFGCLSSIYLLDGDPTYGGTIEQLIDEEGVYGARAWCKDNQSNLYFFSGDGLYKSAGGRSKPVSLSELALPNWSVSWELNPNLYRVTLTFDSIRNGIIISHTCFTDGSNKNYWYDLKTGGFYPETYPISCGIFSSYYYNSMDSAKRVLLLGCTDGYLRKFEEYHKSDEGTAADSAINSYVVLPIISLNKNPNIRGLLNTITFEVGEETDGLTYYLYSGDDAESLLEDIKSGVPEFLTGTLSTTGRSNTIRPRARGYVATIKLSNSTADESWAINKIHADIIQFAGRK